MNRIAAVLVLAAPSFAASKRIISCKGEPTPEFKEGFRLNILEEKDGDFKAVLSDGYSTMNSLFTWKVDVYKDEGIVIENVNKTPLQVVIDKQSTLAVDGLTGYEAVVNAEFDITPYTHPTKHFTISGRAACDVR